MAKIDFSYIQDINGVFSSDLPWDKLSESNILIVGATGLIGSCLVEILMNNPCRKYEVFAAGRNIDRARQLFSRYLNLSNFHIIQCDVSQPIELDTKFHYIIHAASDASPNAFSKHPVDVMKANILGVINLLDYGINHGLGRFLYVSSGEVYGEGEGRPFTENDSGYINCMLPRACYPSSKRAAETLCASYSFEYGIDVVVVRPCHTFGPHFNQKDNRAYAQFFRKAVSGENIILKSLGSQLRTWCYVVDCANAILHVLLKGNSGEVYNIADPDSEMTIYSFANKIAEAAGTKVVFEIDNQNVKPIITGATFDVTKLFSLGWHPMNSIDDNIASTINELKHGKAQLV